MRADEEAVIEYNMGGGTAGYVTVFPEGVVRPRFTGDSIRERKALPFVIHAVGLWRKKTDDWETEFEYNGECIGAEAHSEVSLSSVSPDDGLTER